MINQRQNQIGTIELSGDYTQIILLPPNSTLLDLIHREAQGHEGLTLVYQTHDTYAPHTAEYEILFNGLGCDFQLDKSYKYLASVKDMYYETYSIAHWRRILSDNERRELKIDHLLTQ